MILDAVLRALGALHARLRPRSSWPRSSAALALLGWGLAAAPAAQAGFSREMQLEIGNAVVKIEAVSENGHFGLGSGVIVAPGKVVTNCHVTRKADALWVLKHGLRIKATAQRSDIYRDLCLLSVPRLDGEPIPMGSTAGLDRKQPVMAIGYTGGLGIQYSEGEIQSLHRLAGSRVLRSSNWFSSGASGGGLFDREGRLVGILTFRLRGGERHYYSTPVEWVRELLAAEGADQPIAPVAGQCFWELGPPEQPHFLRAAALMQGHAWSDLSLLAERWAAEDPQDSDAPHLLGVAFDALGRHDEAERAFKRALALDPQHARVLVDLGLLYQRTGRADQARKTLATLSRLDPEAARQLSHSLESR